MPNKQATAVVPRNWPKEAGPKPSNKTLELVVKNGLATEGTKTALAVAMALRPTGTTQPQIMKVLGKPHRNKLRRLVETGRVKRIPAPKQDGVIVYRIELKKTA